MRHQVAHRHGPCRRAQPVGAGGAVEGLEHLQPRERREIFLDRIVEAEAALLDELHRRRGGDRFGHRCDPEQRIGGERAPGLDIGHAERALIEGAPAVGRHGDDARDGLVPDGLAQPAVERPGRLLRAGDPRQNPAGRRSAHNYTAEQGHEFASLHRSSSGPEARAPPVEAADDSIFRHEYGKGRAAVWCADCIAMYHRSPTAA
jgi:hypothetical protein